MMTVERVARGCVDGASEREETERKRVREM